MKKNTRAGAVGFLLAQVVLGCQSAPEASSPSLHLNAARLSEQERSVVVKPASNVKDNAARTPLAPAGQSTATNTAATGEEALEASVSNSLMGAGARSASTSALSTATQGAGAVETEGEDDDFALGFEDDRIEARRSAAREGGQDAVVDELPSDADKEALDADSERSPEELARLLESQGDASIEGSFALCEDSIYMQAWQKNFDARWLAENSGRYKRNAKQLRRALAEARSQEYMTLLFPALGSLNFDYPVLITDDVIKWMQYFQTRGRKAFVTWLRRAEDVIPQMRPVLERFGLPQDLVYLAMIESGFNNRALSVARAAGPWQFMRATGKIYNLRINDYVDERRDPAKATVAAASYLTYLYTLFGDWHLAAASYNAGEGRVGRALRGAGSDSADFFSLSEAGRLPNETRNYVPKLIAAMIISKNPTKFGFEVAEGSKAIKTRHIKLTRPVALADLAESLKIDIKVLESLNPELRVGITPPPSAMKADDYALKVPDSHAEQALAAVESLPRPSLSRTVAARVKRRESVASFASRYGVTVATLLKSNPSVKAKSQLNKGQVLVVPVALGSGQYEKLTGETGKKSKKKFVKAGKGSRKLTRIASRKASARRPSRR